MAVMLKTGFLWILLTGLIYAAIHSAFASSRVKNWVMNQFEIENQKAYRLEFVLQSFIFTIIYLMIVFALPDHRIYLIFPPWQYLFVLIDIIAAVCAFLSLLQTGIWTFFGLDGFFSQTGSARQISLNTHGFYHYVRHPLYLFSMIFIWLLPIMTWNILAFNIGATAYLLIGSVFEERKLVQDFGQEYLDYHKQVPAFVPRLKLKH
jgi:methanethiol S-methyltransferase